MSSELVQFFREAGVMIFLMLVTGGLAFAWSVSFAYRPTDKKRRVVTAFSLTTVFGGIFGFLAGMRGVAQSIEHCWASEHPEMWWKILIIGTSEASANCMLAGSWLALIWLFVAVGETRNKEA